MTAGTRASWGRARAAAGLALALAVAPGCLLVDPINQRPSIDIVPRSSDKVYRNQTITLDAVGDDPEGQAISYRWRAYACTDATAPDGCDAVPWYTALSPTATFTVPPVRADVPDPVQSVRVELEGTDSLGATARPIQQLVIQIEDAPPELDLHADPAYDFVVGTPVRLYAKVADGDDGPHDVQLDWQVFSPADQPSFTLGPPSDASDPNDPAHRVELRVLQPENASQAAGKWDVQVTARDPLADPQRTDGPGIVQQRISVNLVPDHPPCLGQWAPIAPPDGQTLPISDPTLFQVTVVNDDLDPYPTVGGDPVLGTTSFAWSLLAPGATTREPLPGATGNRVAIDPASYEPGDVLELRVEIQDRNHTAITCADDSPTCSVVPDPACLQRLTWRVEIR